MPLFTANAFWIAFGFFGQLLFTARFLVQWIASERKGESVVPVSFWYLSLSGGWILLAYAIYKQDPVFIAGQAFGAIVYSRNLILVHRKRNAVPAAPDSAEAPQIISLRTAREKIRSHG